MTQPKIDPKQQHLDDHYGPMSLRLVDEPTDSGEGMTGKEATSFLRALKPVTRLGQSLAEAAKKAKAKG